MLLGCDQFESLHDDTVVTVMVYMCGSDLESELGSATKDLEEMLAADLSEQVNVIIETGGTRQWKNDVISTQRDNKKKIDISKSPDFSGLFYVKN